MTNLVVLLGVLGAVGALALWVRARGGRVVPAVARVDADDRKALGAPAGGVLLLEFTAPGCAPCVATQRLLDELAAQRPEVAVHAVDVGDALPLARTHRVLRAPTVLVVAADGEVLGRVAGVPRRDELAGVLDSHLAAAAI